MTRRLALWLALVAVIMGGVTAPRTARAASTSSLPSSFVTYPLGDANAEPFDLRLGPDGNWWAPLNFASTIDRVTTSGAVTSIPWGGFLIFPRITPGSDGNLWMLDLLGDYIDKLSPAGSLIAQYHFAGGGGVGDITLGPDGNVWWTEINSSQIGRITPSGVITEFSLPAQSGPGGITAGPDGNVWFTEEFGLRVGRITPAGAITEYHVPALFGATALNSDVPSAITTGPDGNLWYSDPAGAIGRVTPAGVVTEFVAPLGVEPTAITAGPDGNIWFSDYVFDNLVGRITPSGQIATFNVSGTGVWPNNITSGPDGRLWLTLSFPASVDAFQPFAPARGQPDVRDISTRYSAPSGGGQITITGYDVGSATQVLFGSTPATSFSSIGPGQLVVTVPPHAVGATDITVVTPYGTTASSAPTLYTTGSHFFYQATNCGTVITKSTQLSGDIGPCYTGGVTIAADNITFDLGGHSIIGFQDPRDGSIVGINLPQRSGVTVENGTESGFDAGVHIGGGSGNTVAHMNIHDNIGPDDAFIPRFGDGIMIEHGSSNNQIVHNVINHNGVFDGIGVYDPGSDGNTIAYNVVENTIGTSDQGPVGEGIIVNGANGNGGSTAIHGTVIEHNTVSNSGSGGIANINEIGATIAYNTVTGSGAANAFGNGIGVQVGFNWNLGPTNMLIEHNQVSGNGVDGIRLGGLFGFFSGAAEGNTVAYNVVTGNGINPSVDGYEGRPQGFDLDDADPTCGTDVWLNNTWGSGGFTPPCTTTSGSGPAPKPGTAPRATAPNADPTTTFPRAQEWTSFLKHGRS